MRCYPGWEGCGWRLSLDVVESISIESLGHSLTLRLRWEFVVGRRRDFLAFLVGWERIVDFPVLIGKALVVPVVEFVVGRRGIHVNRVG